MRLRRLRMMAVVAGCSAWFCAGTAAAQSPEATATAQKRFEDGRTHFAKQEYEAALGEFQASYAVVSSPNARLFIARCHRELGHISTAYTEFKLTASEAQQRIASNDKKYTTTRDSAAIEAEELELKVSRVLISLPGDLPADFKVMQNGREVPRAAWGIAVPIDAGQVKFEGSGHRVKPFQKVVDVKPGDTARVEVAVEHVPTAFLSTAFAARPTGMVARFDGVAITPDTLESGQEIDPGPHEMEVLTPGYEPYTWKANLSDRQREKITIRLALLPPPEPKKLPRWVFYSAAGAAVVSVGVATTLAVHGSNRASTETNKDPLLRSSDTQSSIQGEQTASTVLFAAGGVLAAGSIALIFFTDWKSTSKEKPKPSTDVAIGPGGAFVFGSF